MFSKLFSRKVRKPAARRPARFRPRLEALEDRLVPTAYYWNPPVGVTNWDNPGNQGWYIGSNIGAHAVSYPGAINDGSSANFDLGSPCTLNHNLSLGILKFFSTTTTTLTMGAHTLDNTTFVFDAGTIAFGSAGGILNCTTNPGEWEGTASFTGTVGNVNIKTSADLIIRGASTDTKTCAIHLQVWETATIEASVSCEGTIDFGTTGDFDVRSSTPTTDIGGTLIIGPGATKTETWQFGAGNTNMVLNEGTIKTNLLAGTTDIQTQIDNSSFFSTFQITKGTVQVEYVTQEDGRTEVSVGATFKTTDTLKGYEQSGGFFRIIGDTVANGTATTVGLFAFDDGNVYINSTEVARNVTWANTGGSITFGVNCDLYLHVGTTATDLLTGTNITLGGTIHVKNNGTFAQNATIDPIQASTALSGVFAAEYLDWTGTTLLSTQFTSSKVGNHYRLTKK